MKRVPRHKFVPMQYQKLAYANRPLPIAMGQTISQPLIVAKMTELLDIKPGQKILEIGTGSGYQAAILSELTPYVYTIEIVEELGRQAMKLLYNLGYATIKIKIGDGYKGWKEYAPFIYPVRFVPMTGETSKNKKARWKQLILYVHCLCG